MSQNELWVCKHNHECPARYSNNCPWNYGISSECVTYLRDFDPAERECGAFYIRAFNSKRIIHQREADTMHCPWRKTDMVYAERLKDAERRRRR